MAVKAAMYRNRWVIKIGTSAIGGQANTHLQHMTDAVAREGCGMPDNIGTN
jgi:hypothetical protein